VHREWTASLSGDSAYLRLALRPMVVDGTVYAASHDGEVMALSAKNGKRLWTVKTKLALSAGPEVDGGLVVLGSSDGDIIALSSADGKERWRKSIGSEVLARPLIAKDVAVIVPSTDMSKVIRLPTVRPLGRRRAGAAAHAARDVAADPRGRSRDRGLRQRQGSWRSIRATAT
jgi:outer membrane protein assembly factor BamB